MNLFVFGLGFNGPPLRRAGPWRFLAHHGHRHGGRRRGPARRRDRLHNARLRTDSDDPRIAQDLADSDALLVSAPPNGNGDPVLPRCTEAIAASRIGWIGYLSTIGVYGDQGGAWIDETTPPPPAAGDPARVVAEEGWARARRPHRQGGAGFSSGGDLRAGAQPHREGPRGALAADREEGSGLQRIHVDDIATTLLASLDRPRAGAIYNVTDDEPTPPQTVIEYRRPGRPAPAPGSGFRDRRPLPHGAQLLRENKRVRNTLIREELGVTLAYPTYREGLAALADEAPAAGGRSTGVGVPPHATENLNSVTASKTPGRRVADGRTGVRCVGKALCLEADRIPGAVGPPGRADKRRVEVVARIELQRRPGRPDFEAAPAPDPAGGGPAQIALAAPQHEVVVVALREDDLRSPERIRSPSGWGRAEIEGSAVHRSESPPWAPAHHRWV